MVTRAQTRANYDRLSRWYDLMAGSSERKYRELGLRMLDLQTGERAVEIGSGTGQALLDLSRSAGAPGAVVGLDLSGGMCRVARDRLAAAGSGSALAAVACADAVALPLSGNAFDAVFMSFTLELFDAADMSRVLEECRRVLREAGRLGVVCMSESSPPNLMTRLYTWVHRRFPAVVDCRPISVSDLLEKHSLHTTQVTRGSMWGLPVEIVVATKAAVTA
jgi:ubiquinone/menaquinone biosynthesis C-methylase UbiE